MSALLPAYARADLSFVRGEGAYLVTDTGERYLDFGSGVAVTALGHAHPHLVAILKEQADKLWHTSNLYNIADQKRLAERLCAECFADKAFFCNSGAEAVECAIKMARKYHALKGQSHRYRLITFEGAFHGRTLATIAAGGQKKLLEGFGPPVEGFDQVPAGDVDAVKEKIGDETAGILIEPIQGEGGIREIPVQFLKALRKIADDNDLVLIFDEVQTGMGRTGHLFAHQHSGVSPDIMALAKGIAGGFPVGACLATDKAASGMVPGSHGSTFGGNPLAMAVANGVLDIMLKDGFLQNVRQMGLHLKQKLANVCDEFPNVVEEVRGEGLLLGLKCKKPVGDVVAALQNAHLLTVGAGDNVVRFLPPLIVAEADLSAALSAISTAFNKFD